MDSRVTVQVPDPKPSAELPGFQDAVHVAMGNYRLRYRQT
jgi:hypothetical protein